MAVHLTLLEIGVRYQLEKIDFGQKQQRDPQYLTLNPQGRVPTLIIDGHPYTESAALVMMLADRHPEAGIAPKPGSDERNQWYQWMTFMSTVLGGTFRHWFYPEDLGAAEHPTAVRTALQEQIESAWARLDTHLAENGPYLSGDSISAADLLLIMYMRWSRRMPRTALDWPALKTFAGLVRQRESWQRLCDIEKLEEWRL